MVFSGELCQVVLRLGDGLHAAMNVVELRRYVTKPGRRDELIELFELKFVESQEECRMTLIGQYCDLDDPNRFIWFRGFADMFARREALTAFYVDSAVWKENRDAANATLVDSDDVFLLRPARSKSGFDLNRLRRAEPTQSVQCESFVAVTVLRLDSPAGDPFVDSFERDVIELLEREAERVAYFVAEEEPNNFPRLPVREGEWVFVVAGVCADEAAVQLWVNTFETQQLPEAMRTHVIAREFLRLRPTTRSLLR